MKVTALIPDQLIAEIRKYTGRTTITESLIVVLDEYVARQRLLKTIGKVRRQPLSFKSNFSASKIRKANREA